MHYNEPRRRNAGPALLAFVTGAAVGAAAVGFYLLGPKGKRNRERAERWLESVRDDVYEKMQGMSDATKERYEGVVDDVLTRYAVAQRMGTNRIQRLKERLKSEWDEVRRELEEEAKREERDL